MNIGAGVLKKRLKPNTTYVRNGYEYVCLRRVLVAVRAKLFKPEVGSQVLVDYQNGLAEQPFVLGNMF